MAAWKVWVRIPFHFGESWRTMQEEDGRVAGISKLLRGKCLHFVLLGSHDIAIQPRQYDIFAQGVFNSPDIVWDTWRPSLLLLYTCCLGTCGFPKEVLTALSFYLVRFSKCIYIYMCTLSLSLSLSRYICIYMCVYMCTIDCACTYLPGFRYVRKTLINMCCLN